MTYIVEWKLDELMQANKLSNTRLEKVANSQGNLLEKQTIKRLREGNETTVDLSVFTALIPALQALCNEQISIDSLVVIRKDGVSKSGLPYTSCSETNEVLDDVGMTERLLTTKAMNGGETTAQLLAKVFQ